MPLCFTVYPKCQSLNPEQIRGAPAIASLAALSVVSHLSQALKATPETGFLASTETLKAHVEPLLAFLFTARPTAVNLGAATRRLRDVLQISIDAGKEPRAVAQDLINEGRAIDDEDITRNKAMAKCGADWLLNQVKNGPLTEGGKVNVMTVCNTGSLATSVRQSVVLLMGSITLRSYDIGIWDCIRTDNIPP